jgi:hypothetical protein
MTPYRQYRGRVCGWVLPAWLAAAQRPDGAMLLHHLADRHPSEIRPSLPRMATEEIAPVAAEAYEVVGLLHRRLPRLLRGGENGIAVRTIC